MHATPATVTRDFMQQAWVVADLDKVMFAWVRRCGVGPFFVAEHVPMEQLVYRGSPVAVDCTIALAQSGRTQIELIVQHSHGPSIYRDLIPEGRSGFHHLAVLCKDYQHDLEQYQATGCAVAMTGVFVGMRFAYVDCCDALGCVIELIEDKPFIREHFEMIARAAKDWDGSSPIRPAF